MKEFETVEVVHVPRKHNARADILSKLVSRWFSEIKLLINVDSQI